MKCCKDIPRIRRVSERRRLSYDSIWTPLHSPLAQYGRGSREQATCAHQLPYLPTHTHTRLTALCPGLRRWAGAREVKPIWISLKHQLGYMQLCTSLQTDNHASTPLLRFLQAGCPSCRLTNSIKAQKAQLYTISTKCTYLLHQHTARQTDG